MAQQYINPQGGSLRDGLPACIAIMIPPLWLHDPLTQILLFDSSHTLSPPTMSPRHHTVNADFQAASSLPAPCTSGCSSGNRRVWPWYGLGIVRRRRDFVAVSSFSVRLKSGCAMTLGLGRRLFAFSRWGAYKIPLRPRSPSPLAPLVRYPPNLSAPGQCSVCLAWGCPQYSSTQAHRQRLVQRGLSSTTMLPQCSSAPL